MFAKTMLVGLLALAAMSPSAAAPFHHNSGQWREYNRDWLAACPDAIDEDGLSYEAYSCFASTGSQELNGANLPAYALTLIRNRLTGDVDIAVTVALDQGETDPSRPLVLTFGGEVPEKLDFVADLETRHNVSNQYFVKDAARRDALLERMKQRNAVLLGVPLTGADVASRDTRLSLRGVAASLDFMTSYARKVAAY